MKKKLNNSYKSSGVNIKKSNELVREIEDISSTFVRKEIINNPGGFSALFDLKKLNYNDPILLSSTDGVGTKLKLAIEANFYNYLGYDLVGMCVNDILVNGGEPIFFLDYLQLGLLPRYFQMLYILTLFFLALLPNYLIYQTMILVLVQS